MSEDETADLAAKPLDPIYLNGLLDNISATQDHLAGDDGTPLSHSLLPPNAAWTPREKNAFFHALSIHSRFRPDLISYEIQTKSVPDVCNYLSVLQLAACQQESTVSDPQWRQNLPIAMEVSSEWVAMEEETAPDVTTREQDWNRELIAERRRVELKLLKKTSRTEPRGTGPSRRKAELKQEIASASLRHRREDFCGSLGSLELTVIGSILNAATGSSGSSQTKQPPAPNTPTLQHTRREPPKTHPFSAMRVTSLQDPLGLVQRRSDKDGGSSPPSATEPAQPYPPQQESIAFSADLSPASRRRHQKRLYMRRKRASMSGVTVVDDSLERLKPGRKKIKRSPSPEGGISSGPESPTSVDHDMEDKEGAMSVCGADESVMTRKRYPRAKQLTIDKLRDLGLTADDLRGMGVNILNPEGVAKMLNLWDKLSEDTLGHGSRISIETIQLLDAHVVWFVKNLVYRTITLREQERGMKSETRVWKLSGKPVLAREHIEKAISMGNSRELNKTGFFEGIVADMNIDIGAKETGGEFVEGGPDVALPPLHRDIYAPLVWIPEPGDDSEMTDNTDEGELERELVEEEELDELDMDIEVEHESGLWNKAQRVQTSGPKTEALTTKRGQLTAYKSAEFIEDSD